MSNQLESLHSSDPNQYWRFWRNIKSTPDTPCSDGVLDANVFAEYYIQQSKPLHINYFDQRSMADIESFINQYQFVDDPNLDTIINDLLNAPICLEEVSYSLKCIKTGKATHYQPRIVLKSHESVWKCLTPS